MPLPSQASAPAFPRPLSSTRARARRRPLARAALTAALLALSAAGAQAVIPTAERDALIALYNATDGDNWFNTLGQNKPWKDGANFRPAGTECEWFGVDCDGSKTHVLELTLNENGLTGQLPPLNALSKLWYLNLTSNRLHGPLPSFSGLSQMDTLGLGGNQFTGPFPDLTGMDDLYWLHLWGNQLSGNIHPSLSTLRKLEIFQASNNALTGPMPDLSLLTGLQEIRVENNQLSGPFPDLSAQPQMQQFQIWNNNFTGTPGAAPAALKNDFSRLCPNPLTHTDSPAWDAAAGVTPWSRDCASASHLVTLIGQADPPAGGTVVCGTGFAPAGLNTLCEARPAPGYVFDRFVSGCSTRHKGLWCQTEYLMNNPHTVTAHFVPQARLYRGPIVPDAGTPAGMLQAELTGGGASCVFDQAQTRVEPAPSGAPTLPQGMFKFKLSGCDVGSSVTVTVRWPNPVASVRKYGRDNPSATQDSFYAHPGLSQPDSRTTVITLTDGGLGDADGVANGEVVDPIAPITISAGPLGVTPVPTLGEWSLLLLGLGAAGLGAGRLRKKK